MENINDLFDLDKSIAKELFEGCIYPWDVIPKIKDYIIFMGNTLNLNDYHKIGSDIWVAKDAEVSDMSSINGPLIICKKATVRPFAYIRGSVIIGENCVVGNSSELKNCILFDDVQVPHYNYVGDSILGNKAHLGAGVILSNVKSDKNNVVVKYNNEKIKTNMKKLGSLIGDNVEIGCGAVLNPGTIIGKNTNVYPLSFVRGEVPSNSIYKHKNEIVEKYNTSHSIH